MELYELNKLNSLLKSDKRLLAFNKKKLEDISTLYPWFPEPYQLLARRAKIESDTEFAHWFQLAAIYSENRTELRSYMEAPINSELIVEADLESEEAEVVEGGKEEESEEVIHVQKKEVKSEDKGELEPNQVKNEVKRPEREVKVPEPKVDLIAKHKQEILASSTQPVENPGTSPADEVMRFLRSGGIQKVDLDTLPKNEGGTNLSSEKQRVVQGNEEKEVAVMETEPIQETPKLEKRGSQEPQKKEVKEIIKPTEEKEEVSKEGKSAVKEAPIVEPERVPFQVVEEESVPPQGDGSSFEGWLHKLKGKTDEEKRQQEAVDFSFEGLVDPTASVEAMFTLEGMGEGWSPSDFKGVKEKMKEPVSLEEEEKIARKANESLELKTAIVTETMADLLLLQNKKEKAASIFKQLMEMNPEKSAYFAARIKELE